MTSTSETAANDAIAATVVEVLRDMTSDWDLELSGGIGLGSQLVNDLGCESLDIVMLIVALEGRFGRSELPWGDMLLVDGDFVEDLTVADLVVFLSRNLSSGGGGP